MKSTILNCFNKNVKTYDEAAILQRNVALDLAKMLPKKASRILEIGCGTGLFTSYLMEQFPEAEIQLVDLAPNMIEHCKNRFKQNQKIRFQCGDGEEINWNTTFDLIVSNMSLHWFSEHVNSFQRLIDHLQTSGHFLFAMVGNNSMLEWKKILNDLNYPVPTPYFPDSRNLKEQINYRSFKTKMKKIKYENSYGFLSSLKKIGAIAKSSDVNLSPGALRNIIRTKNEKLTITFEIIFGHYVKP